MEIKEFFSNLFFTIAIGTSAVVAIIIYTYNLQRKIKVKLIQQRHLKMVADLTGHHIVCGFGRAGDKIVRELLAAGEKFIIIDKEDKTKECAGLNILFICGDPAKDEEILHQAQIKAAKSVFIMAGDDIDCAYITGNCRRLNPKIFIISRVGDNEDDKEIKKLGADIIIDPTVLGEVNKARELIKAAK